jgi:hypothetical protein
MIIQRFYKHFIQPEDGNAVVCRNVGKTNDIRCGLPAGIEVTQSAECFFISSFTFLINFSPYYFHTIIKNTLGEKPAGDVKEAASIHFPSVNQEENCSKIAVLSVMKDCR